MHFTLSLRLTLGIKTTHSFFLSFVMTFSSLACSSQFTGRIRFPTLHSLCVIPAISSHVEVSHALLLHKALALPLRIFRPK
jgi:hypothetical protein